MIRWRKSLVCWRRRNQLVQNCAWFSFSFSVYRWLYQISCFGKKMFLFYPFSITIQNGYWKWFLHNTLFLTEITPVISSSSDIINPRPADDAKYIKLFLPGPPVFIKRNITSFTSTNVKLRLRFDVHLTFPWHSPEPHLTTWPSSDLPLTLTRPLPNID